MAGGLTAYLENGSASDIAYAAGVGALSGALTGLTLGAYGTVAVAAVAGAAGNVSGQLYAAGTVDPVEAGLSGVAGAAGALAGLGAAAYGASEVGAATFGSLYGAGMQGQVDATLWPLRLLEQPPATSNQCQ